MVVPLTGRSSVENPGKSRAAVEDEVIGGPGHHRSIVRRTHPVPSFAVFQRAGDTSASARLI
jgi:hypothetical protein